MSVRRLNRRLTRIYDAALRPLGITSAQLNVLTAVALAGKARPTDIARALDLEKSTLSRNLERMIENGWLESIPGPRGTTQLLRLRPAGRRLFARAVPAWRAAQQEAGAEIEKDLLDALERARGAARRSPAG